MLSMRTKAAEFSRIQDRCLCQNALCVGYDSGEARFVSEEEPRVRPETFQTSLLTLKPRWRPSSMLGQTHSALFPAEKGTVATWTISKMSQLNRTGPHRRDSPIYPRRAFHFCLKITCPLSTHWCCLVHALPFFLELLASPSLFAME